MELFVINRHGDERPEATQEEEQAKLDRVVRKIERKRQQRIRQREREREKQRAQKGDSKEPRQRKKRPNTSPGSKPEFAGFSKSQQRQGAKSVKKRPDNVEGFTILGAENAAKKTRIEPVLPAWLAKPTVISSNLHELTVKVSKVKQLDRSIRERLKANGIKYFFPVQAEVIPWLLEANKHVDVMFPRDICVSAPTGSGKTLAFVVPVVQALKRHTVRKVRVLVILPTQDLAEQVFKTFRLYTAGTNIETGLVTGKHSFSIEQKQLLYLNESFGYISKIDILVCTAGRLVSHIKSTEGFDLKSLEFLIIDEADRVLENIQDDWLYHLEKHIFADDYTVQSRKVLNLTALQKPRPPQKLLFSATLTQDPEKLEKLSLFQPKLFTSVTGDSQDGDGTSTGQYTTPNELTEKYIVCSKDIKPLVLYVFIKRESLTRIVVFTHSIESTHRLKILLRSLFKSKLKIEEISSNLRGKDRDSLISSFTNGEIDVLICTDALARGIDLPGVSCVVSYSAPKYLKTYIHRAGRTARAGEEGLAVTLLHNEQVPAFKALLSHSKKDIGEVQVNAEELQLLSERYRRALGVLKETITKEEKAGMIAVISKKKSLKKMNTKTVAS